MATGAARAAPAAAQGPAASAGPVQALLEQRLGEVTALLAAQQLAGLDAEAAAAALAAEFKPARASARLARALTLVGWRPPAPAIRLRLPADGRQWRIRSSSLESG